LGVCGYSYVELERRLKEASWYRSINRSFAAHCLFQTSSDTAALHFLSQSFHLLLKLFHPLLQLFVAQDSQTLLHVLGIFCDAQLFFGYIVEDLTNCLFDISQSIFIKLEALSNSNLLLLRPSTMLSVVCIVVAAIFMGAFVWCQ
jgi:hypothetical protein